MVISGSSMPLAHLELQQPGNLGKAEALGYADLNQGLQTCYFLSIMFGPEIGEIGPI